MKGKNTDEFGQLLVEWYRENKRDYPWRRTTDPWAILVSEMMLQQTTIPTVLARYESWLNLYPTPATLASANERDALRSWEGLGYYRRVRSLRAIAQVIVQKYGGKFPQDEAALLALPGIGPYTAAAVLSFAFNRAVPLVDANVARVLTRIFDDETPIDTAIGSRLLRQRAANLLNHSDPRAYNSALMELGQTICTPGRPDCAVCPVRSCCSAKAPEKLPVKMSKPTVVSAEHWDIWLLSERGLLMEQQPATARHAGMYRLPRRPREHAMPLPHICDQHYTVTRYKVTRHLHLAPASERVMPTEQFIPIEQLEAVPLASPDRKIVRLMLNSSSFKNRTPVGHILPTSTSDPASAQSST